MQLKITTNTYSETNVSVEVSPDLKQVYATSYNWWPFIVTDEAGNVIFNDSRYSNSTSGHQRRAREILQRLGIKINLELHRCHNGSGFNHARNLIAEEIETTLEEIKALDRALCAKGARKSLEHGRESRIKALWFRIRDLERFRDHYVDKQLHPPISSARDFKYGHSRESTGCTHTTENMAEYWSCARCSEIKSWQDFEKGYSKYFRKSNGKLQVNELRALFAAGSANETPPTDLTAIVELFGLNQQQLQSALYYEFIQDTSNLVPHIDSDAYIQLKRWLKRNAIDKQTLNLLALDKLHTYLTNKQNRKTYESATPIPLNVHPQLLNLEGLKGLKLIKTVQHLRAEGRRQSHCIGGEYYLNRCKRDYSAVNYKGYTFFFGPQLDLIETRGRHNCFTPIEVVNELYKHIGA